MELEDVLYEKKDGVAILTFNRPDKMNSYSPGMMRSLFLALEDTAKDDDVRVFVLTGAGRGFCAGADVRAMRSREDSGNPTNDRRSTSARSTEHSIVLSLQQLPKPTIAMVNGVAVGGGCDMALACDMRIASEAARFGEVYIKLGLVPANGGMFFLPRLVGLARACELIFTGDIIDAKEAEKIGLVNKVVPADELEAETMDLARKIAMGPPIALRYAKAGIYECLTRDLASSLLYSSLAGSIVSATEDHKEGVKASAERRQPMFKGR